MKLDASHLTRLGNPVPVLVSHRDFIGYGAERRRSEQYIPRGWNVLLTLVARPETAHLLVFGSVHEHITLTVAGKPPKRLHLYGARVAAVRSTMGGDPQVELHCERVVRRGGAQYGWVRSGVLC